MWTSFTNIKPGDERVKNYFEYQLNKLCDYINSIGYHAHKNHPERLNSGKYIKGEPYDYEIFLPGYKACFDAKQTHGDRWDIEEKDIKQAENLKHCKNSGMDAFFLVYYIKIKKIKKIDVDVFIKTLQEGRKSIRATEGEDWNIEDILKGSGERER